jgi:hypothetical protein
LHPVRSHTAAFPFVCPCTLGASTAGPSVIRHPSSVIRHPSSVIRIRFYPLERRVDSVICRHRVNDRFGAKRQLTVCYGEIARPSLCAPLGEQEPAPVSCCSPNHRIFNGCIAARTPLSKRIGIRRSATLNFRRTRVKKAWRRIGARIEHKPETYAPMTRNPVEKPL